MPAPVDPPARSGLSRRTFLGGAAAALLAPALLSACAKGASSNLGQAGLNVPDKYKSRKHKVLLWTTYTTTNAAAMDALLTKFNESQSDIFAQAQFQGTYADSAPKFTSALQAGKVPDVMLLADTYWGHFLLDGVLEPLDGYFDAQFNKENYLPELVGEGVAKGKLYWLPFGRSTPLFYYNRTLFNRIGLPDRGPASWTELREWGNEIAKVKVNGKAVKTHAFTGTDDWEFEAAVWQFGGRISEGLDVTIDQGGAIDAATFQLGMVKAGQAYLSQAPTVDFGNQLIATCMDSTGALKGIYDAAKFDVGASKLPIQKEKGIPTGGGGFVIPAGIPDDRKHAAVEVLKFLATPASSAQWTVQTGYLPVAAKAAQQPDLAALVKKDPNFGLAIEQLPDARKSDAVRLFAPNGTTATYSGLQKIFGDRQSPQSVLGSVADQLRTSVKTIEKKYTQYYPS